MAEMKNTLVRRVHVVGAVVATLLVFTFFTSTIAVETFGDGATIAALKRAILYGIGILVAAMAATGASGAALGRLRGGAPRKKLARTRIIALNGLLVLVPSAVVLDHLASAGDFGTLFMAVQALELLAGAVNLTLLALNARDGLRMSGRLHRAGRAPS